MGKKSVGYLGKAGDGAVPVGKMVELGRDPGGKMAGERSFASLKKNQLELNTKKITILR